MDYILKKLALSHPFANGEYDYDNANPQFINGINSYKEWLEHLPVFSFNPNSRVILCDDGKKPENCPMRHSSGNCMVVGGFCTAVSYDICKIACDAYNCGRFDVFDIEHHHTS